ncbi:hypothetical protein OGAPHI_002669 [Ogataea philodendri]|uniref:Pre-mRNA-processing factor 19 n=1 Tax=Ogataea philodendri TaxID=1378263 RepID=A0A9P8T7X3_9ASCO|nr:uncharacterized protein OGAPHI_002669 [Ogataea philodendri]KAH3668914.1 hypothetical protein OGAPHI_002669 [Ogataea philodendri]
MICSISNTPAEEPVVSPKSGHVFEKRVVEKYIQQQGKDPISGESLSVDELIPVQVSALEKPLVVREASSTSIPSLLTIFQREWDALALESFELRKQLTNYKKELSLALYKQDAAVRVAAAAIKERDEAKKALEDITIKLGTGQPIDIDEPVQDERVHGSLPLAEEYSSQLTDAHVQLYQQHKSHKYKSPIGDDQDIKLVSISESKIWENQKKSSTATSTVFNNLKTKVLVGYSDNTVVVYDVLESTLVQEHSLPKRAKINGLGWLNNETYAYAGTDGTLTVTGPETTYQLTVAKKPAVKILGHPLLPFLFLAQKDTLSVFEGETKLYESQAFESDIKDVAFHQDGLFLGLLFADNQVKIFNTAKTSFELTVSTEKVGQIVSIDSLLFAPNGYSLALHVVTEDGPKVGVYDLRKDTFQSVLDSPDSSAILSIDPASTFLFNDRFLFRYHKKSKQWGSETKQLPDIDQAVVDVAVRGKDDGYEIYAVLKNGTLSKFELLADV